MESRGSVDFLFGDFHLDPSVPCLYRVDKAGSAEVPVVDLSTNAFKLLRLLAERKGQVVSHQDIFAEVWYVGPRDMDRSNIHMLVSELRRVLGRASIENAPKRGYWIKLKVTERPRPADPEDEKAITTLYGMSPERLQELIKAAVTDAVGPRTEGIDELSNRLEVTQKAAIEMLRVIGQADVPLERLPEKLVEVAEQYKSVMARLAALDPQDPTTHGLIDRARAAWTDLHYVEAVRLVGEAEQAELAAVEQARQLAQQAQAAAEQRLLAAAAHRGMRGDIAMAGLRYVEAAQHFQQAADLVPAGHPDEKGRFLRAKGKALEQHGDERGDNAALVDAIANYRLALHEYARDRAPFDWAKTQNGLGSAMRRLGERESGTERLEQAVAAYRAALEALTRQSAPLDWATTQNNLGAALLMLGERRAGPSGWRRQSPPSRRRSRNVRAIGCRSIGR